MNERELQDAILRHALDLQRVSANDEAQAVRILRELEADLRRLLASNPRNKREINALIAEANKAIEARYGTVAGVVDIQAVVATVAENTFTALRELAPLPLTAETVASLSREVLIDGSPAKAWWAKQAEDTAFRFAASVRQGIANGETQERIVSRIAGRNGFMEIARRNARTLVHSSVMTAANHARLAVYRKNSRHISGVRWLSTLDSHTCTICAALDGAQWNLEGEPVKGNKFQFQAPPAHFSCRCVLSPVPKSLDDILGTSGIDSLQESLSRRASKDGPVAGSTTFADFLARQSPDFIENTLGKKRAALFSAGKITLRDLVSGTGRPLTLDELRP